MQDSFDHVPLGVPCRPIASVCLQDRSSLCRSVLIPESGVHVHITEAVVYCASCDDPQLVNIDSGLGGHDLGGFKDYDICLRTDKHSQWIYGPSVAPLESSVGDGKHQVTLVDLGGSQTMHEFLVALLPGRTGSKWTILIVFSGLESGAAAHYKLGEFLTLAYLCLGSKLFGVQNVSALICSRSMLFRCGLAHDTNIFDIVHDS